MNARLAIAVVAFASALAALTSGLVLADAARGDNGMTRTVAYYTGQTIDLNPCTGEQELLQGRIVTLFHLFSDASGGQHLNGSAVAQDLVATGLTSGNVFHEVQASPFVVQTTAGANVVTITGHFKLVGPGGVSFVERVVEHVTVRPDGTVAASFDRIVFECT
jgi:hypothetical protein